MTELEAWFKEFYAPLTVYAWKMVGDRDTARELVQELFMHLAEKPVDVHHSPKAYLYQAVRNRCLNHLQRQQRTQAQEVPWEQVPEPGLGFEDPVEATEFQQQLYQWIEALPPACREVFKLSRFEGKKHDEIARQLGISKRTVETQISKALKLLRARLAVAQAAEGPGFRIPVWFWGLLLIGASACEKPLIYRGPTIAPTLVVNSAFSPDSSWQVELYQSQDLNDTARIRPVSGARLLVRGPNGEVELTEEAPGRYLAPQPPQAGAAYSLTVLADGFTPAFARDTVPLPAPFRLQDTLRSDLFGFELLLAELAIAPLEGTAHYFLEAERWLVDPLGDTTRQPLLLFDLDERVENEGLGGDGTGFERLFARHTGNGRDSLRLAVGMEHPRPPFLVTEPLSITLVCRLTRVSHAYYAYQRSLDRYLQLSLNELFPQPQAVVSNVEQGYGVFGGYATVVRYIPIR